MRNYSKTGGKKGRPGYRTPSSFRSKKEGRRKKEMHIGIVRAKIRIK